MSEDDAITYAAVPARTERVRAEGPVNGILTEHLVEPLALITEEHGEVRSFPAWVHPVPVGKTRHDPCNCTCGKDQGWPYEQRRATRQVIVPAEGPARLVTTLVLGEVPMVTVMLDGAFAVGRTSHSKIHAGSIARKPSLSFGTDLAPDQQPLGSPAYLVAISHTDDRDERAPMGVVGTEHRPARENLATKIAKASTYDPPKVAEGDWTADQPLTNGAVREAREGRFGDVHYRVQRTEAMGDAALHGKGAALAYRPVDLREGHLVDAVLIRAEFEALEGLLAYAHSTH